MKLLYFAWLKSKTGVGHEELPLPAGIGTVSALVDYLKARSPGHAAALEDLSVVRVAVNQEFADFDAPLTEGDEVAFFPPVTGG